MKSIQNFIVGIDAKAKGVSAYRIVMCRHDNEIADVKKSWEIKSYYVNEAGVKKFIADGNTIENACIAEDGSLVGDGGSFGRFAPAVNAEAVRPLIVVSEIVTNSGGRLGYKVLNYDAKLINMPMADIMSWISKCSKYRTSRNEAVVPFQNAFVRGTDSNGKSILVAYPGKTIFKEEYSVGVQPVKPTTALKKPTMKSKTTSEEVQDIVTATGSGYSKACGALLVQAAKEGVNVKPILKPVYNKEQLTVLIEALKNKREISRVANPNYTAAQMSFGLRIESLHISCVPFMKEKFNKAQQLQIILGVMQGVRVLTYAQSKVSASDMEQIRMRLEDEFWCSNSQQLNSSEKAFVNIKDSVEG